jgi:hypothetical protein
VKAEVWILFPEAERATTAGFRRDLLERCQRRSWTLVQRPIRRFRDPSGRPLTVIDPNDAANLYRRMHRARLAVFLIGTAHVREDPSQRVRSLIPIERYIRYKSWFVKVDMKRIDDQLDSFQRWLQNVYCTDEHDPRCLPMHIFDAPADWKELHTIPGRKKFEDSFGPGSRRMDSRGLEWAQATARHGGREPLYVAGMELTLGFHWDLSRGRRKVRVCTSNEVWQLLPEGHLNVYPDGYIRKGSQSRRVWPS